MKILAKYSISDLDRNKRDDAKLIKALEASNFWLDCGWGSRMTFRSIDLVPGSETMKDFFEEAESIGIALF